MTSRETVGNKGLNGSELKEIMIADFARLLDNEGMLNHYVAYGRIAYTLTLALHTDNPMRLESSVAKVSQPSADRPAVEAPPLVDTSKDAVVAGAKLDRRITSPNEERLRHGLPLHVTMRGADGTVQTEQVKYPPSPELGPGDVTLADASAETREAWKVPAPTT